MAFYRECSNGIDSDHLLGAKGHDPSNKNDESIPSSAGDGEVQASSSDKDVVGKADDRYQSEEEVGDDDHVQVDLGNNTIGKRSQNFQQPGRRSALVGKWGSSFWKDCQVLFNHEESDSGRDSKNMDSDLRGDEGSTSAGGAEQLELEDLDGGLKDGGERHRGQVDVPADEMLSDDYYEQDGDEQSESLNYRASNSSKVTNTGTNGRSLAVKRNTSRSLKSRKAYEYDDDDDDDYDGGYGNYDDGGDDDDNDDTDDGDDGDDDDYKEEDEEEDDELDDVDFKPQHGGRRVCMRKAQGWESDDHIEDDKDDNVDVSDESDEDYMGTSHRRRRKGAQKMHSLRKPKSFLATARQKRGKAYVVEDESSAQETEKDSDDDFDDKGRRALNGRKKSFGRPTLPADSTSRNRELRSSGRSVRKVSYVESEESEQEDESKMKNHPKAYQEDAEEEDGDAIEKVLWHQPKGVAQDASMNNRSIQPVVSSSLLDSDVDWDEVEFFIKWKGQSHLHCQWQSLAELKQLSGFKKVLNYMKRVKEERKYRKALSREEVEVHDVSKEMELDLLKQYSQVERVFADRIMKSGSDDEVQEYLVKWRGLSYAEATWEKDTDIAFAQDAIDEYKAREAAMFVQGKMVDGQRKKSKASLRKLVEQPEWLKGGTLRDYQLEGLNFLVNSWRNDTNVILADEMGLGKTVQSVSMLGFLQNAQQIHGPFLVVVPLSTLTNWAKEFRKWLPEMNVVVYVGNRESRRVCEEYEFYTNKKTGRHIKLDTLLTTYEVVLKDKAVFSKIRWNYLMVDEAHRLKNSEASLYTTLSEVSTKNKLLITGTPLQNSVEELWALLHFLDSEKFKSKDDFIEKYKNLSSFNEIQLGNLHKELRPHLLRRVIKDVEKSLPPKIERILRVEMSPLQKQYYKWILERNFHDLNKGVRGNQVSLLNIVVELKKCCNHPFLFESADHGYGGNAKMNDSSKVERIVLSSGKLVILDKLLVRLKETNHRVLIFSQMVRMLDILAEYLSLRGFQFQRLDGSTRADLRHQAMEHFNAPGSEDFCFLLSTRAGGLGINLATADTVIIFDSDWNPQNDLQAMSRAHRIGQQEVVNIYRFVTSKSVEEDILERAKKKMVLDHLVIQKLNAEGRLEKKETKKGASMFDKNELSAILRFGAEELFKEDRNDEEGKRKLENMDIDEILERAEKVESKGLEAEEGNELLNAFKVANFSNAEDDATFWSRWIQPEAVAQAEDALVPRAARNTKSYAEVNETEKSTKRKNRGVEERASKRNNKASDLASHSLPVLEGASGHVREWSGGNLSKKDANSFIRAIKKFGDQSRISLIVAEVGGAIEAAPVHAQIELFNALIDGCKEVINGMNGDGKGAVLDFFGVSVKAQELLDRVQELQLLSKRIKRYQDPVAQFRLRTHPKNPSWSKSCSWNQVDDARLLLGIYYHGYGNWEKIRLDTRLGLTRKMAPAGLSASETFLPRAPHLDTRASVLLRKEFEVVHDKSTKVNMTARNPKRERENALNIQSNDAYGKYPSAKQNAKMKKDPMQKRQKVEPRVKEEGEISESEEPDRYKQYKEKLDKETKEEKWREWCAEIMSDEIRTLRRLEKLQTTSVDLPKEEAIFKVKTYLQVLGKKIDFIVKEHGNARNYIRMTTRLWNHVANFSNLSGERLSEIYSKLKEEQHAEVGPTPSDSNTAPLAGPSGRESDNGQFVPVMGSEFHKPTKPYHKLPTYTTDSCHREQETGKSEAWKRRRRSEIDNSDPHFQPCTYNSSYGQSHNNGSRLHEPNMTGILGWGPPDNRRFAMGPDKWGGRPQQPQ
ncbi:protein CHROMATIN REMODELING 5 [Amborella trichopoda]|uniref:protein CHROMATIN REMODELING 5 n=1 Tax=Amborella trichopoda TaxID=13333 RepID=UPI0005D3EEE1|nr:protein CHROMATIN REMODELING 5 [Amborella trichopoda]|eukprot:XP_011622955.1 protein CHROMATIN REMODELING 5 [Amborella trichopoda]